MPRPAGTKRSEGAERGSWTCGRTGGGYRPGVKPGFLRDVYDDPGPFATAYLGPEPAGADTADSLHLRWRALAERLREEGADAATVEAMAEPVMGPRAGRRAALGSVIVGARGRVLFTDSLEASVGGDRARWSALPELGPYLRVWATRPPRQVVALADRAGADLLVRDGDQTLRREADGETHPLHKVRGGGWAHERLQNTVEEIAERNAAMVAGELDELVRRSSPAVVVLAGEVEARSRVHRHLPRGLRDQVFVTEKGGRAPGSGADLDRLVEDAIAEAEQRARADLVERLESGVPAGTAVKGVPGVLEAVQGHAVDTLLYVVDERGPLGVPDELAAPVYIGADPRLIGGSEEDLSGNGEREPRRDLLDSALAAAVVADGSAVEVLTGSRAGVAALLRFAGGAEGLPRAAS